MSSIAQTPPMGWNSFDCYDLAVNEEDVLGNAHYMARHLKTLGYEYIVVDMSWYDPASAAFGRSDVPLILDEHGRYLPDPVKFPSSEGGAGFRPLADQVHALGLKFGIHIMRGISRQAVRLNTPVLSTSYHAQDIADTTSTCGWWEQSYGINPTHPGAQAWYDSLFAQYAAWHIDFIKADDCASPYHPREIALIRNALDRCGRPMVLSLSPGETPIESADHVKQHANMWRISADFWDHWPALKKMFELLEKWAPHIGPGHWPDADMLPLGAISLRRNPPLPPRFTRFTAEEQKTLMTLWCIARSPLMFGGDLRVLDPFTTALITNPDVLAMHRHSSGNRPLFTRDYRIAWTALGPDHTHYVALFNISDFDDVQISVTLAELNLPVGTHAMEIWTRRDIGPIQDRLTAVIPPHGAQLFRLQPQQR